MEKKGEARRICALTNSPPYMQLARYALLSGAHLQGRRCPFASPSLVLKRDASLSDKAFATRTAQSSLLFTRQYLRMQSMLEKRLKEPLDKTARIWRAMHLNPRISALNGKRKEANNLSLSKTIANRISIT